MKFELRDYQIKALNVIDRDLQTMPEVLLQGITGCGKTTIFSRLINKYYKETDRRFLVLVHKQEVVQQIYDTLRDRTDIKFQDIGICCASLRQKVIDRRVTIASIQTFVNVMEQYSYADLIIVDEAHKIEISSDTQYRKAFN
ncbi:MAG: DEAD/DEAH box helicase family protein, partial [Alphaproteobacteria bacterium]